MRCTHQHALGDHQAFAAGQVGTTVDAVEVAEVVQPGIGGVADIDVSVKVFSGLGAHGAFVDDGRHQVGRAQQGGALVAVERRQPPRSHS